MKKSSSLFKWVGFSKDNIKQSGEIHAHSLNLAKWALTQQGITLLTVQRKKLIFFTTPTKKISATTFTQFFRQLSVLLNKGIPALQCCDLLISSEDHPTLRLFIQSLKAHLASGRGFYFFFRQFPHYFNTMTCHLIELGEQTGTLDQVLARLVISRETHAQLKQRLIQALIYPACIFSVACSVIMIMLVWVIPRFEELFHTMIGNLPLFTQFVIGLSDGFRHDYWIVFIVLSILSLPFIFKNKTERRNFLELQLLKVPWIGLLYQKTLLARIARHVALTFGAGIPLAEGLGMVASTINHHHYEKALHQIKSKVESGLSFHLALHNNPLFSPLLIQFIQVGEETGSLESMLNTFADLLEKEINHTYLRLTSILEPLIILILGVLIGGLVIAMYLPIFKLGTLV